MTYICLNRQIFLAEEYSIVPIRIEDKYEIMKWRNEQIYHLRQSKPLTIQDQDAYFSSVITKLFSQEKPNQILFSYLKNDVCIGYGGLVHINWLDRNAEISFLINTELEQKAFQLHWATYLGLIEKVGFEELKLHKLYVYAFDLRQHLYTMLERNNYLLDARLKDHCFFNGSYKDVVIYAKFAS